MTNRIRTLEHMINIKHSQLKNIQKEITILKKELNETQKPYKQIVNILTFENGLSLYTEYPTIKEEKSNDKNGWDIIIEFDMNSRTSVLGGNLNLKGDRLLPEQVEKLDKIGWKVVYVGEDKIGLKNLNL